MPLKNFGIVSPGVYRGGQPDEHGVRMLRDMGVTAILKLNAENESDVEEDLDGIVVWRVPLEIGLPPFEDLLQMVGQINAYVQQREPVFIHCTHGRDRTGFVVAAYELLVLKRSYAEVDESRAAYGVNDAVHRFFNRDFTRALKLLVEKGRYGD